MEGKGAAGRNFLVAGDMGVGTVIMYGFKILGTDRKPRNIIIFLQFFGNVPHDIFNKLGIGKCTFGDMLFVHAL